MLGNSEDLFATINDELLLVRFLGLPLQLRIDLTGEWISAKGSTEQQNVRLRAVIGVVLPSTALLYT